MLPSGIKSNVNVNSLDDFDEVTTTTLMRLGTTSINQGFDLSNVTKNNVKTLNERLQEVLNQMNEINKRIQNVETADNQSRQMYNQFLTQFRNVNNRTAQLTAPNALIVFYGKLHYDVTLTKKFRLSNSDLPKLTYKEVAVFIGFSATTPLKVKIQKCTVYNDGNKRHVYVTILIDPSNLQTEQLLVDLEKSSFDAESFIVGIADDVWCILKIE